jgi:hypothetical protein
VENRTMRISEESKFLVVSVIFLPLPPIAVFLRMVTIEQTTSQRLKIVVNDCLRHVRGPVKTHYD